MMEYTNSEGETFFSFDFTTAQYDRGLIMRYAPKYYSSELLYINYFPSEFILQLGIILEDVPNGKFTFRIHGYDVLDCDIHNISLDEFEDIKRLMSCEVLDTCDGPRVFTGRIDEEAKIIFTSGLCANFAKVLQLRCPYLELYYTIESFCGITHMFCYNPHDKLYYDITGSWTKEEYRNTWGLDTIFQPCPTMKIYYETKLGNDNNDKYAEAIVDEYITMYQL